MARLGRAFVDVRGAVRPGESSSAFAMSALPQFSAGRSIDARIRGAGIVDFLASRPGESLGAGALVLIGRCILTRAAVLTGLVRAAIVEILVAEDTTPVRVADTLPAGTVAVSVLAAGIRGALVAQFTAPSVSTLALAAHVAVAVHWVATLLANRWKMSHVDS